MIPNISDRAPLANLDALEHHPEMPLHQKRGMLDVLSHYLIYKDYATQRRYHALAESIRGQLTRC